jgi:multiple sugar transport system permease protein
MLARARPAVLLLPGVTLLAVFIVFPCVFVLILAFWQWDLLSNTAHFVGLDNFRAEFDNGELTRGLFNTLLYAVLTVPISLSVGLVIAVAITAVRHGGTFWRAVYFLPVAATLVAMAVVWRWMFAADTGLVDRTIGRATGLTGWLSSDALAMPAVAVVGNWQQIGFVMVIYLSALANAPATALEAARLDGANPWQRFWHVTWPSLGPATVFAVIISCTGALRVYDTVRLMTDGGPVGQTETLTYLLWRRGIYFYDVGAGAALTVVLIALTLVVTVVQLKSGGDRLEKAGRR